MTEYYVHLTHREQLLHITRLSKMTRLSLFFHQDHILTVKEKKMLRGAVGAQRAKCDNGRTYIVICRVCFAPKSETGPFKTPTVTIGYCP